MYVKSLAFLILVISVESTLWDINDVVWHENCPNFFFKIFPNFTILQHIGVITDSTIICDLIFFLRSLQQNNMILELCQKQLWFSFIVETSVLNYLVWQILTIDDKHRSRFFASRGNEYEKRVLFMRLAHSWFRCNTANFPFFYY